MGGRLVLAVFIDGYGHRIASRHPILRDRLRWTGPLRTEFGYSSTCDPTILTGAAPRDHGHFSFFVFDPARSPFRRLGWMRWLPGSVVDRGRVRGWISRALAPLLGYTGYFQLYAVPWQRLPWMDYTEKRDLYQPGGILGGQRTLFDDLRAAGLPFHLSDWRRSEEENLSALEDAARRGTCRLAWIFLGGLDGVLHRVGTGHPEVGRHLAWYDERLRRVLELADRAHSEVRLHLFSDHGMADVTRTVDVRGPVEGTGLVFGRDYAAVYDSTMARFWYLREGARDRIEAVLAALPGGSLVPGETLREWGCDFPGERYGQRFWLADPGVLIVPSDMGRRPLAGMHGYRPDDGDMVAFYGTSVEDGPRPASLRDLKGLLLGEATR